MFKRDNVEWDQELLEDAEKKIKKNTSTLLPKEKAGKHQCILCIFLFNPRFILLFIKRILSKTPTNIGTNSIQFTRINFSKTAIGCLPNLANFLPPSATVPIESSPFSRSAAESETLYFQ